MAYVIIHLATYHLVVNVLSKKHLSTVQNKEIQRHFGPFVRNDT